VFEVLNPIVQACAIKVVGFGGFNEKNNNIFGVGTSMEESSHALIVGELSLFKRLYVIPTTCVDPLAWWWIQLKPNSQMLLPCHTNIGNFEVTN